MRRCRRSGPQTFPRRSRCLHPSRCRRRPSRRQAQNQRTVRQHRIAPLGWPRCLQHRRLPARDFRRERIPGACRPIERSLRSAEQRSHGSILRWRVRRLPRSPRSAIARAPSVTPPSGKRPPSSRLWRCLPCWSEHPPAVRLSWQIWPDLRARVRSLPSHRLQKQTLLRRILPRSQSVGRGARSAGAQRVPQPSSMRFCPRPRPLTRTPPRTGRPRSHGIVARPTSVASSPMTSSSISRRSLSHPRLRRHFVAASNTIPTCAKRAFMKLSS